MALKNISHSRNMTTDLEITKTTPEKSLLQPLPKSGT